VNQLNPDNFFDNVGGGGGAPSALLKNVDDFVIGEIVDQFMTEATDFSTKKPKTDSKTGETIMQLVVVLQTEHRNWENVVRIPKVDKDDRSSADKAPEEDDGRRAVYLEPWTNIHAAVGKAVIEATGQKGPVRNGGTLGVKVVEHRETGKGNPLKVHAARYTAPVAQAASDGFFNQTAGEDPAPAATQSPAVEAKPEPTPAAAPAQNVPTDPWTGQPAAQSGKPPF
jgi:hypothetical protein